MNKFDGYYRVIFEHLGDKFPDETPIVLRLIELENKDGKGIAGKWCDTDDGSGTVELHIPAHPAADAMHEALTHALANKYLWQIEAQAALALADEVNDE